jgi:fused signal recognition particle receptor
MSMLNRFFGKKEKEDLNKGLEKTRESLLGRLSRLVVGKSSVDDDFLDELEAILMSSDVGLETTNKIIERVQQKVSTSKYINASELNELLRGEMVDLLAENNTTDIDFFALPKEVKPYVILVVGVNGVGKTTSIGKLAFQFKEAGFKVVLGAADTFRAAAVDQLKIWSERVSCHFYGKGMNADPAAVAYETVQYAIENGCDIAIIDTAGRLHTKVNLMNELSKIKRSVTKKLATAPNEVILVLDATTGQNAFEQAKHFTEATDVSGLILTKLDGTAKGGVAIGISDQFKIPIRFIGVGEGMYQLQVFRKRDYVDAIFDK